MFEEEQEGQTDRRNIQEARRYVGKGGTKTKDRSIRAAINIRFIDPAHSFRIQKYVIARAQLTEQEPLEEICLDPGCIISINLQPFYKRRY